jgi:hypothetical protein
LLVNGWTNATTTCTAGGGWGATWGLYVDGTPVTGSAQPVFAAASGSTSRFVLITGMTGSLPAGTHTVELKLNDSANVQSVNSSFARITAVALGG